MQDLTNEQKIDVLLHALDERYKSIHAIRDRVQNCSIWILGIFVTAGGWLLQSDAILECREKLFFSGIIIVSVAVLRIFYLSDLERGFKTQQRIQARIEDALGLYKPGVFVTNTIYPSEWSQTGTRDGKGNFFSHNYLLIYLGTAIILLSIWLK